MSKLHTIIQLLKANGMFWLFLYIAERVLGNPSSYFFKRRMDLEIRKQLPGFNTTHYNYKEWSNYDWSRQGEEWTNSEEWKNVLVNEVIKKNFLPGKTILEIGPGAGRWSVILAELSNRLILVDMTEKALVYCKKRLQSYSHCLFYKSDGSDLSFLQKASVDYVWSFDVFVHMAPLDTDNYLQALGNAVKSGGIGIIHHPAAGGFKGGFRSSMTNDVFCQLLRKYKFEIILQFDSWGKDNSFTVHAFQDMITIFKKT
jgi:ubiquinone/menaquinone biosynthesis C-methylase UbiE